MSGTITPPTLQTVIGFDYTGVEFTNSNALDAAKSARNTALSYVIPPPAQQTIIGFDRTGVGQSTVPVGLGSVKSIAANEVHTCAIKADDTLQCWRDNDGQSNVPEGLNQISEIATGNSHTCVLEVGGAIKCWGKINSTNHGSYSYIYDISD